MKWITAVCLSVACGIAHAGDPAYAVRDTNLKAKPFADAQTLSVVAADTRVEILQRKSGWMQVKVSGATGWVKMLSLRLSSSAAQKKSADNGFAALFNVASTGNSGSTVTTGVRGLSEEQLKNTHANPQELEQAQAYAASKAEARKFAQEGKLSAHDMAYLPEPKGEK